MKIKRAKATDMKLIKIELADYARQKELKVTPDIDDENYHISVIKRDEIYNILARIEDKLDLILKNTYPQEIIKDD